MTKFLLDLQLFGEGGEGAPAGDGGQTSGVDANVVAEQRLRELGVPADRARKRASKVAEKMQMSVATPKQEPAQVDTATTQTEEAPVEEVSAKRMTWDEIKNDPEYNKEIQKVVSSRLKTAKVAEDTLAKLTPAIEVLARKHGFDMSNMDYDALAKAIEDDDTYYEDKALEMGTSVEVARRVDQMERADNRRIQMEQRTLEEQRAQEHFDKLDRQAGEFKKIFPNFDMATEMQNPTFARLVHTAIGMIVEDAYHAIHRKEIQAATMQLTEQKTMEKVSSAIQAGSRRPVELGTSSQAPSTSTFDYRNATKEQRESIKRQIRSAAARGEKLYPNQIK